MKKLGYLFWLSYQKCIADPNQKEISDKHKLESLYGITDLYSSKCSYFKRQKAIEDSPAIWSSKHVCALSSGSVSQFFMLGLRPLAIANAWLLNKHTAVPSLPFLTMPCPPNPKRLFPLPYHYFKWQVGVYFCKECAFHSSSKHKAGNVIDFYSYSEHCVFSPLDGIQSYMLRELPSFQGEGNEESENQVSHSSPPRFRNVARPLWKGHHFSGWWRLQNSLPKISSCHHPSFDRKYLDYFHRPQWDLSLVNKSL